MLQPQQHSIPEGVWQTKNSTTMMQLLHYAEWVIHSFYATHKHLSVFSRSQYR
ncbi:hypothetical protein ACQUFW_15975 [Acinetobacter johnsonii]|uniref:hypothetical protein n=1 Tax=Acinetobacter johnsonii TaxID=40214 RepID=UPI003D183F10